MKISELYKLFCKERNICIDSRAKSNGGIFFAIKGEKFDGNKFALQALENGCTYAVIDNNDYKIDNRFIIVENVLETLQNLATYHREKLGIPILAITGTNGKTTTKELVYRVLSEKFCVKATIGNLNNHIGVPLTLLSMDKEVEFGIVEMGANHEREIEKLCNIAKPNYGIVTNIGKAHIEGFGSFENIIKAKNELYNFIDSNNGVIFYNDKNKLLEECVKLYDCKKIKYSDNNNLKFVEANPILKIKIDGLNIETKLFGDYNFENILATVCLGTYFDININNIRKEIEAYIPKNNRSQLIKTITNTVFLDAYNANPTSVELALKNFINQKFENKTLILGEMLELGKISVDEHLNILKIVRNSNIDSVYLVGEMFTKIKYKDSFKIFANINELIQWQIKNKITNRNIFIKGSRGNALEKIVEYL